MVSLPVFRGTPKVPLWIKRNGVMVPAWAEDPCDTACCELCVTLEPQIYPRSMTATISGLANLSPTPACSNCASLNARAIHPRRRSPLEYLQRKPPTILSLYRPISGSGDRVYRVIQLRADGVSRRRCHYHCDRFVRVY